VWTAERYMHFPTALPASAVYAAVDIVSEDHRGRVQRMKLNLNAEEVQLVYDCVKSRALEALEKQESEAEFDRLDALREKLSYRVERK